MPKTSAVAIIAPRISATATGLALCGRSQVLKATTNAAAVAATKRAVPTRVGSGSAPIGVPGVSVAPMPAQRRARRENRPTGEVYLPGETGETRWGDYGPSYVRKIPATIRSIAD